MKDSLIVALIGAVVIGAVGENTGKDIIEGTRAEIKMEEEVEAQAKVEEFDEKVEQEGLEEIQLQIMRENLSSFVDVQFDKANKVYTMTPTDQGLIDEISMLSIGIGHESWGVMVDGMIEVSKSLESALGEGYSVAIVNPLNHENFLLWIIDGVVIYNVIDDL